MAHPGLDGILHRPAIPHVDAAVAISTMRTTSAAPAVHPLHPNVHRSAGAVLAPYPYVVGGVGGPVPQLHARVHRPAAVGRQVDVGAGPVRPVLPSGPSLNPPLFGVAIRLWRIVPERGVVDVSVVDVVGSFVVGQLSAAVSHSIGVEGSAVVSVVGVLRPLLPQGLFAVGSPRGHRVVAVAIPGIAAAAATVVGRHERYGGLRRAQSSSHSMRALGPPGSAVGCSADGHG